MNIPVWVSFVASPVWAMPKSMTTGSLSCSMTLPGFRSRCTTPAACTATSAWASPLASRSSAQGGSGPCWRTTSSRVWPGTYLVTM